MLIDTTCPLDPAELDSVTECPHCAEMLYESELALHLSDECPRLHGCDVCAEPAVIRDDGEAYCLAHAAELVRFARVEALAAAIGGTGG